MCVTHRTILLCLFSETGDVELPHHTDQDPLATASTSLLFPHVDEFGESEKCVLACVCKGFAFRSDAYEADENDFQDLLGIQIG